MSLRDQIVAAQDRPERKPIRVDVPEWGFPVYLRRLTVADQVALAENVPAAEMPVQVLLHCLVDADGERALTDDDAALLSGEDFPVVLRLFSEAAKLNGLTTAELEEAMEAFGPARDEQPSTGSPSLSGAPSENSKPSPVLS